MNLGGPSIRLRDLVRYLEQGMLRASAHRQQGDHKFAILVVMPHLQKSTCNIVGQEEHGTTAFKEGWQYGREPLTSVAVANV